MCVQPTGDFLKHFTTYLPPGPTQEELDSSNAAMRVSENIKMVENLTKYSKVNARSALFCKISLVLVVAALVALAVAPVLCVPITAAVVKGITTIRWLRLALFLGATFIPSILGVAGLGLVRFAIIWGPEECIGTKIEQIGSSYLITSDEEIPPETMPTTKIRLRFDKIQDRETWRAQSASQEAFDAYLNKQYKRDGKAIDLRATTSWLSGQNYRNFEGMVRAYLANNPDKSPIIILDHERKRALGMDMIAPFIEWEQGHTFT